MENLDINRQNVDAIKDSVATARDLAAPFNLTAEAAKKINKANRDLSSLNRHHNGQRLWLALFEYLFSPCFYPLILQDVLF